MWCKYLAKSHSTTLPWENLILCMISMKSIAQLFLLKPGNKHRGSHVISLVVPIFLKFQTCFSRSTTLVECFFEVLERAKNPAREVCRRVFHSKNVNYLSSNQNIMRTRGGKLNFQIPSLNKWVFFTVRRVSQLLPEIRANFCVILTNRLYTFPWSYGYVDKCGEAEKPSRISRKTTKFFFYFFNTRSDTQISKWKTAFLRAGNTTGRETCGKILWEWQQKKHRMCYLSYHFT